MDESNEEYSEKLSDILGQFIFHLADTHGIPMDITKERIEKGGFLYFRKLFMEDMPKHKDFMKKWKYQIQYVEK